VDDDSLVCDSVRRLLEFDHHTVTSAINAEEALHFSERETFDLVIVDYLMPGMKGDQLAFVLKHRFPDMPVLMITADAQRIEKSNPPAGVDLVMIKPFQLEDLRYAMNKLLVKA
jgi:CheY-like chemotaxis protein